MTKSTFNRAELIRITNLVRPALAAQPYIPALVHIQFDGGFAIAYNDVAAIKVRADLGIERLVPGELLARALGGLGADSIAFTQTEDGALVLKSGRSTVKMPTMPCAMFPLQWPSDPHDNVEVSDDVLKGIERCLLSVGKDPKRPAHMGVTLDIADGSNCAALYSTDNVTISRYLTDTGIELPGNAPVILPKFFCEQLVSLAKAFPEAERTLLMRDGSLEITFGDEASLLTRTPVDLQPLDFPTVFDKHCPPKWLSSSLLEIPDGLDGALSRAVMMLAGEASPQSELRVTRSGLRLTSGGNDGESVDELEVKEMDALEPGLVVKVDPIKLARGAKVCAMVGFGQRATVMTSADSAFAHIIAHVA